MQILTEPETFWKISFSSLICNFDIGWEKNNKMKEKENENSRLERGIILAATWKFTFQFKRQLA